MEWAETKTDVPAEDIKRIRELRDDLLHPTFNAILGWLKLFKQSGTNSESQENIRKNLIRQLDLMLTKLDVFHREIASLRSSAMEAAIFDQFPAVPPKRFE